MEDTHSPGAGSRIDAARLAGHAWTVFVTLAIWLSLICFPIAPEASLDGSWQEVLIYAHVHGFQFGRGMIFTWGPWGFLCSQYHLGATGAGIKLLWETAGKLAVAASLVYLTRSLAPWRRVAFAAAWILFHGFFLDITFFVLIVLMVLEGLMRRGASLGERSLWIASLGFLAQIKFTYMVLATAGVGAAAIVWLGRRHGRLAAGMAAGYCVAVVLCWLAAGQNLDNLYPYVRRSLDLMAGYGDAMGLDESWPVFGLGAGVGAVCLVFIWQAWKGQSDRGFALGAAGIAALAWFVMWKEAFTRADGHVNGFFAYTLILAFVLPGIFFAKRRFHWFDLCPALCLAGLWASSPDMLTDAPRDAWLTGVSNARAVARMGRLTSEWQQACLAASAQADLPAVRRAVGRATVDVYDFNQGIALLNGLNFVPRPIFQSYTAYTPGLEGWNLRFYQSAAAPDFLLETFDNVDNRYPSLDDAPLFASLPLAYVPVLEEGGYLLLRKKASVPPGQLQRRLLVQRTLRLGEEMEVPPVRDHALWLQASVEMNTLGRLRALLYKPPIINLSVSDAAGNGSTWRILPRLARDGFLLEPFLESGADFKAFMLGRGRVWLRSLRFEAPAGQGEFWRNMDVHLFELPQLPIQPESLYARVVESGIVDREPLSIESPAAPQEIFPLGTGHAMLLHAPGELVLPVPSGARSFIGAFGIRDGAFSGGARTAGVEFVLEGTWADGRTQALWRRFLDPLNQSSDRGPQRLELALPREVPERLTLRTLPGPRNDNRWDWSYVSGLGFLPASH